jgi:hypothetical protein
MSIAAAGGGEDDNGGGDRDSSHYKGENTNATSDSKKMSSLGRGMLRYLQGKTADAIARGAEPCWDAFYAPPDMHHYLKKKNYKCHCKRRGTSSGWSLCSTSRPRVLLIHQLEKLPRKLNLHRHIARMTEVCHFV